MIESKEELKYYLEEDSRNYGSQTRGWTSVMKHNILSSPISDQKYIWKYIKTLRYAEYYLNTKKTSRIKKLIYMYYLRKLRKLSYKTGFQIPPNTVGPGLTIWHWGPIIINGMARIGKNATLYPGVLIGHKEPGFPAPVIGDNCFIGSGSKIIGDITIGDNCVIAQNCVVTHSMASGEVLVAARGRVLEKARM